MENKKKRFYKQDEVVWVIPQKKSGVFKNIDKKTFEVTVEIDGLNHVLKAWEIDKVKYKAKQDVKKEINVKHTYFASVEGGIVPTRNTDEDAGRDCYARIEEDELLLERFSLTKIPLGFASYLQKEDVLSIKHERSSVGGLGLINISGLIDSTYQGEVILQVVPLTQNIILSKLVTEKHFDSSRNAMVVPLNKAIAQAVVLKQSTATDKEVTYDELLTKPSKRGTGGWGSSGK